MATNKRTFYAIQAVGIAPDGVTTIGSQHHAHGVQSVGVNTNFNLEQIFELGQLNIYENIENIPDIEVTLEKVFDGYPMLYHMATQGGTSDSLAGRQNQKAHVVLGIWPDTQDTSSGVPTAWCSMSGMFWSSWSMSVQVDGAATESLTLVGNNKVWNSGSNPFVGVFYSNADSPLSIAGSGGVNRREDFLMDEVYVYGGSPDVNGQSQSASGSILPPDIPGITSSGFNIRDAAGDYPCHLQSVSVSVDAGRDELFELGRRGPYHRYLTFPTEVRCDIEVLASAGDGVSATEAGVLGNGNNLTDRSIRFHMREGAKINLGTKNKLSSVSYGGADAGGGNATVTYSYSNFNFLTITHPMSGLTGLSSTSF